MLCDVLYAALGVAMRLEAVRYPVRSPPLQIRRAEQASHQRQLPVFSIQAAF